MNNDQPQTNQEPETPILDIKVGHNHDRRCVFVELGERTLMLAPEAAHALSAALTNHATELLPNKSAPTPHAELLIQAIALLIDKHRGPEPPQAMLPKPVNTAPE